MSIKLFSFISENELPKQKKTGGGDVKLFETKGKRNNRPLNENS